MQPLTPPFISSSSRMIECIKGPQGSGKTTELLKRIEQYAQFLPQDPVLIIPYAKNIGQTRSIMSELTTPISIFSSKQYLQHIYESHLLPLSEVPVATPISRTVQYYILDKTLRAIDPSLEDYTRRKVIFEFISVIQGTIQESEIIPYRLHIYQLLKKLYTNFKKERNLFDESDVYEQLKQATPYQQEGVPPLIFLDDVDKVTIQDQFLLSKLFDKQHLIFTTTTTQQLTTHTPTLVTTTLSTCYRKPILSFSQQEPAHISRFSFPHLCDVEHFILSKVKEHESDSFAIVCRTADEVRRMMNFLKWEGIACSTPNPLKLTSIVGVPYLLTILQLIDNPSDDLLAFTLLKKHLRDDTKVKHFTQLVRHNFIEVLEQKTQNESLLEHIEKEELATLCSCAKLLMELSRTKHLFSLDTLVWQVIEQFDLLKAATLLQTTTLPLALRKVLDKASEFSDYFGNNISEFITFLQETKKSTPYTHPLVVATPEFIEGQEFSYMLFPALNQGKFPLRKSKPFFVEREDQEQQEQELFLRTLSRAKQHAYLCSYKHHSRAVPASFITHIPVTEVITAKTSFMRKHVKEEIMASILLALQQQNMKVVKEKISLFEQLFLEQSQNTDQAALAPEVARYKQMLSSNKHIKKEGLHDEVYSVSRLETYLRCPKRYEFQYVFKLPTKPQPFFSFGISVHQALEHLISQIYSKNMSKQELFSTFIQLLKDLWRNKGYASKEEEREYFEKAVAMINSLLTTEFEKKENRVIEGLEIPFFVHIDNIPMKGIIDRIDSYNGKIEILDYKTSKTAKTLADMKKDMQLMVYTLAAEQLYKREVSKVSLWFVIKNQLRELQREEINFDASKARMHSAVTGIREKDFTPKPNYYTCKYCDFSSICRDAKKDL